MKIGPYCIYKSTICGDFNIVHTNSLAIWGPLNKELINSLSLNLAITDFQKQRFSI
jgi:hypothetical protein